MATRIRGFPARIHHIHLLSSAVKPNLRPAHFISARLATMASQTPSKACCETPPIVAKNYQGKGQYIKIDGMDTYTTGPSSAKQAILMVYDIFGFFPQTIQGADILAHSDKEHQYQVFMPDFFEGKPIPIDWYPPDTKEKEEKIGEFFGTTAAPPKTVNRIPNVLKEIKSKYPNIEKWGIIGYCWGGKIVNLVSQEGTSFSAAAAAHPAMVDPKDASGITIPIIMLPSEGESKDDVNAWEQNLKVKHQVEWYPDQLHGFMAARSNLEDSKVLNAYKEAYEKVLTFFHEHM